MGFLFPFLHFHQLLEHMRVNLGAEIKGYLVGVGIKPDEYEEVAIWAVRKSNRGCVRSMVSSKA